MEENEKRILNQITNNMNKLANLLFTYLNFLSPNSEKINYPLRLNKYKSLNQLDTNGDDLDDEIINIKANNFYEEFKNQLHITKESLEEFNKYYEKNSLRVFNYSNLNELYNLFQENKLLRLKNELSRDKLQKNELIFLIFKHIISIGEYTIVSESLKTEMKTNYLLRSKIKPDKNNLNNNLIVAKATIKNYINKNLNCNIEFNIENKGYINLLYFPFHIIIGLPLKDNLYFIKSKASIILNFIHHKKDNQYSILIEKIKTLFENRITSILNLVNEEKKPNNQKVIVFTPQNVTEFVLHFLNFLYGYNDIMNKRCALCKQISRYSYLEKCFFPPYYKLYKTYKISSENNYNNPIINKEKENLFYHEDCFNKISNPSI